MKESKKQYYWYLWTVGFSLATGVLDFWIPEINIMNIHFSLLLRNYIGSFVKAIMDNLSKIKYQGFHSYIIYSAISSSSCRILTTFGNILLDFGNVFFDTKSEYVLIIVFHIIGSFLFYFLGEKFSDLSIKSKTLNKILMEFDNEDQKLVFSLTNKDVPKKERDDHLRERLILETSGETESSGQEDWENSKTPNVLYKSAKFSMIAMTLNEARKKRERISSTHLSKRHKITIAILYTLPLLNVVGLYVHGDSLALQEFLVATVFNLFGSVLGQKLTESYRGEKFDLQYHLFKHNTVSAILFSSAYSFNLVMGDVEQIKEFAVKSFMFDFCGTFSSWSGTVSTTATIYRVSKRLALLNFLGTFGIALGFFIVLNYYNTLFHFFTF